jgi:hypothetical protein
VNEEKLKGILADIVDHVERLNVALLAQNHVLKSHNQVLQSHAKRIQFLEQMLIRQEADQ